jgi:hypothetical protein
MQFDNEYWTMNTYPFADHAYRALHIYDVSSIQLS